jgi:hypothetical protein
MRISNNLGDAKSLITHPATTTHQRLTPAQRAELGISDGLVRVSVGLEHPDDIVEDVLGAGGGGVRAFTRKRERRGVSAAAERGAAADATGGLPLRRSRRRGASPRRHSSSRSCAAVRRDKNVERDVLDLVPVAHDGEAAEQIDILVLGRDRASDLPCPASRTWRAPAAHIAYRSAPRRRPLAFSCSMPSCNRSSSAA